MNSILIVILVGIVTAVLTELTTNAVVVAAFIPVRPVWARLSESVPLP